MTTYIVLLKGVNVGGHHLLPMKLLRQHLEESGFEQVRTYIQSGNIVLRSKENPCKKITSIIESHFNFSVDVLAFTEKQFKTIVNKNPFKNYQGKFVHFYFCKESPKVNLDKITELIDDTERYEIHDAVFYLLAPNGIGRSKLVSKIEVCLGIASTGRNLNTINKLQAMIEPS